MKIKKVVISLLLLLTYSLGFAHNIIPHDHSDIDSEHAVEHDEDHSHHHHHTQNGELNKSHEHIHHNNHIDENLYDLIVCFLNEMNHNDENCSAHYYMPTKSTTSTTEDLNKLKLAAVVLAISSPIISNEPIYDEASFSSKAYILQLTEDTPLRGPPSIS